MTSAVELLSNGSLNNIFMWFAENKDKSQDVTIRTLDGEKFRGYIAQVTADYISLSYDDQFSEGTFTGTIISLKAIVAIDFCLKVADGSSISAPSRTSAPKGLV